MALELNSAIEAVSKLRETRYDGAATILLAGSIVRGEATATSDLDLVVILPRIDQAYRESFTLDGVPVEVFVHDRCTLEYFFFHVDRPSGVPALPAMVAESIEVPKTSSLGQEVKQLANKILDAGPPAWSDLDRDNSRYVITDLIDDLRAPRSKHERQAITVELYSALANHFLRSRKSWSGRGKAIPRQLAAHDREFCQRFLKTFEQAFATGRSELVERIAEEILTPDGGFLRDGYKRLAPKEWRSPPLGSD